MSTDELIRTLTEVDAQLHPQAPVPSRLLSQTEIAETVAELQQVLR